MPNIFLGETLTLENVAEMTLAVRTDDFDPSAVRVGMTGDCIVDFVIEAWPAPVADKFVLGAVERGIALAAKIQAGIFGQRVAPITGRLGAFVKEHIAFLLIELIVVTHDVFHDLWFRGGAST